MTLVNQWDFEDAGYSKEDARPLINLLHRNLKQYKKQIVKPYITRHGVVTTMTYTIHHVKYDDAMTLVTRKLADSNVKKKNSWIKIYNVLKGLEKL